MRILYIQATVVPPPKNVQADRFFLLSEKLEGDVLQPVWSRSPEELEAVFGPGAYPAYTSGRFRYHWFLASRYQGFRRRVAIFWFILRKGMELHRERKYDCIVAYSHMTTGLIAGLLKILTRSKLILEIATTPELVYLTERPRPTLRDRLMHLYSDFCLHVSMLLSDRFHLLYPGQLAKYVLPSKVRNSVFHEFVPVSIIEKACANGNSEVFVLLVGAPWYLKGVDLLIEAFLRLSLDFPGVKLKILGHYPERRELDRMMVGSHQIEILKARSYHEALRIISEASILVLPSRCEGVARVLIEGMAAGVPIIASDAGGIPFVVRDGENGSVFPSGDSRALEKRLRELLANPEMRRRMGDNGYGRAHEEYNEQVYVEEFSRMVEATVRGEK
jgi:glycosyltransferase involved in cell wall biosynthesis